MYAKEKDWVSWLAPMEFAYNWVVHKSIGKTPFEVSHIYYLRAGTEPNRKENHWEASLDESHSNLEKAREKMIGNSSAKPVLYQEGEMVWMSTSNCQLKENSQFFPKLLCP